MIIYIPMHIPWHVEYPYVLAGTVLALIVRNDCLVIAPWKWDDGFFGPSRAIGFAQRRIARWEFVEFDLDGHSTRHVAQEGHFSLFPERWITG